MQAQTAHWIHREEVKAAVLQSLRYYRWLYTLIYVHHHQIIFILQFFRVFLLQYTVNEQSHGCVFNGNKINENVLTLKLEVKINPNS